MIENNDKYFELLNVMFLRILKYIHNFAIKFDDDEFLQHHVAKLLCSSKITIKGS